MPEHQATTVVHGDYRLGNVMISRGAPMDVVAVLDWEMATLGDPLADLGYLIETWSEPGATSHPLMLSPVTRQPGFPSRAELVAHYCLQTGRDVSRLRWYRAFALWKGAVFCEAIYRRYLDGERQDPWAATLADGVPQLVDRALAILSGPPAAPWEG
jgi:aminoglycoside phosphotransferase (APT) family kinase protein